MKKAIAALILALVPAAALATSGGLDANGGHYDHSTGLYHYHHGYPAHQHENGVCPYTGEVWELKIPERPATLAEWNAQKHGKGDKAVIDNETPEDTAVPADQPSATPEAAAAASPDPTAAPEKQEATPNPAAETITSKPFNPSATPEPAKESGGSAVPAAAGAAVLAGGAFALYRRRRKKQEEAAEIEEEEEIGIPEDSVIGEDGLPWEEAAHDAWLEKRKANPHDRSVPTSKSEPKWGAKYTFYLDGDGSEIHTRDCPTAFIQINAADPNCPKTDCPLCHPTRPDLAWYEAWKAKQEAEEEPEKGRKA